MEQRSLDDIGIGRARANFVEHPSRALDGVDVRRQGRLCRAGRARREHDAVDVPGIDRPLKARDVCRAVIEVGRPDQQFACPDLFKSLPERGVSVVNHDDRSVNSFERVSERSAAVRDMKRNDGGSSETGSQPGLQDCLTGREEQDHPVSLFDSGLKKDVGCARRVVERLSTIPLRSILEGDECRVGALRDLASTTLHLLPPIPRGSQADLLMSDCIVRPRLPTILRPRIDSGSIC